jgi:hypothetical protein
LKKYLQLYKLTDTKLQFQTDFEALRENILFHRNDAKTIIEKITTLQFTKMTIADFSK